MMLGMLPPYGTRTEKEPPQPPASPLATPWLRVCECPGQWGAELTDSHIHKRDKGNLRVFFVGACCVEFDGGDRWRSMTLRNEDRRTSPPVSNVQINQNSGASSGEAVDGPTT
ncbi:unnamed protein product [Chrysodeixis includens]|uniref:Uncharacterized protein n=1 Tax=Chrysodeixis includens TaxID=689277 RepID=A0A9N8KT30_CHRIL|nr:unnamed protein product [Chrysodeixis includens]